MLEDTSYFSDDTSVTSPANDFLEMRKKIITKNKDLCMVLLYTEKLKPDD